jgi:hypothetical protein
MWFESSYSSLHDHRPFVTARNPPGTLGQAEALCSQREFLRFTQNDSC